MKGTEIRDALPNTQTFSTTTTRLSFKTKDKPQNNTPSPSPGAASPELWRSFRPRHSELWPGFPSCGVVSDPATPRDRKASNPLPALAARRYLAGAWSEADPPDPAPQNAPQRRAGGLPAQTEDTGFTTIRGHGLHPRAPKTRHAPKGNPWHGRTSIMGARARRAGLRSTTARPLAASRPN